MGGVCDGEKRENIGGGGMKAQQILLLTPISKIPLEQIHLSRQIEGSQLSNSFLTRGRSAVILGCKQGQNRDYLNKYMLTYMFFSKSKSQTPEMQIKDFIQILKLLDESNTHTAEIQNFETQYLKQQSPRQKAQTFMNEYFKNGFISCSIEKFPVISSDPTVIAYIRRPLIDLCKGIKSKYEKQAKKKQIYCVLQLSQEEVQLLNQMAKNEDYFTFTAFVRCFSSADRAKKRQKQLEKLRKTNSSISSLVTLFISIQITNEEIDKDYDYGFYLNENEKNNELGDIVMNIMNFFQVTGAEAQNKEYTLKYNGLARIVHLNRARLLQRQPELLKVNTIIEGQCAEIKTFSHLLRVVKDHKLSISASQSLRQSNNGSSFVDEQKESINLIEAYLQERNYQAALKQCNETIQFKVRKAQIYYQQGKYDKVDDILLQIKQLDKEALKKQHFQQFVLCQYISAKRKIAKDQQNKGLAQLESLRQSMKKQYKGGYEFRGREIQRQIQRYKGQQNPNRIEWQRYGEGLNLNVMLTH